MQRTFSSIDQYIDDADPQHQPTLRQLRAIIRTAAPPETKEIISYNIPTFHWNGNLFHFALSKKHIGIYPGPKAIEAFPDQIKIYKTSKGTIQLPLDQPLPQQLISDLVHFNVSLLQNKTSPASQKKESKAEKANSIFPTGLWKDVLEKNKDLALAFEKLTPRRQKDYTTYIHEAKQDKTKWNRIDKITPMIMAGIGLHDKYKRK